MKNRGAASVISDILYDLQYLIDRAKENHRSFPDDKSFIRSLRRYRACYRMLSIDRAEALDYMFKIQLYLDGKIDDLPV